MFKQILSLNSHKALGPDNISVKYVKTASEFLSTSLCEIFNRCVIEGIFPNELKIAKVDLIDFYIFILLSRESDGGAMHRTNPDSFRSCLCFRVFRLNFACDFFNLLLVRFNQAENIVVKHLIQGRNNEA